jgi:hypothetical protein
LELDGTSTSLADYSSLGVVNAGHHNNDPGKFGMLIEVDTTSQIESVILEVDPCGNVLKRWDLADIISAAMTAGGDDPTQFVKGAPTDWFHNNAVTYRKSDDTLVISSREDFVIAIDYNTNAIKWILGDTTKYWATFPSLLAFSLTLGPNTLPPIGQHAVSFTTDDELLLFDDGLSSNNQGAGNPKGADRTYSAPRRYHLDLQNKVATEVWNYPYAESIYSRICSSIYEDAPLNYVVDYADITKISGSTINPQQTEILGLSADGNKVFDYRYATTGCNSGWNSMPIHFENLFFDVPNPNTLEATGVDVDTARNAISFVAIAGNTYRLEYKNALTDASWQPVGADYVASCTARTELVDTSAGSLTNRFYHVIVVDPTPTPTRPSR